MTALALIALLSIAPAQGHAQGHGQGHGHDDGHGHGADQKPPFDKGTPLQKAEPIVPAKAGEIDALVAQVVKAYGGKKAIKKLEAFRLEGALSAHIRGKEGRLRRDFVAPGKLRVDIVYPDKAELRIVAGNRGWRGSPEKLSGVQGFPMQAMVGQLLRSAPPWALVHHRDKLALVGPREHDGVKYTVLRLVYGAGLDVDFWIEAKTQRVDRTEAIMQAPGMQLFFVTRYRDFKKVKGVLVPFTEENWVRGRHAGTTRVESVRFGRKGLGPFEPGAGKVQAKKKAVKL